ncbi:MAG: hemerythrin domain-containing protein [Magnetospirillum sp.]|nr:hemerythrin domain-containing protein [Magnetospirillum sp.]
MRSTLRILKGEHLALRGIARVLKMEALVLERGGRVDLDVLKDIVAYVREFPMRFHHPKEERTLFAALSGRSPEADALIVRLTSEHADEGRLVQCLADAVAAYARDGGGNLAGVAKDYARYLEEHIHLEDHQLFAQAEHLLSPAAWDALDATLEQAQQPGQDKAELDRFTRLHLRIMDAALPPFGG